MDGVRAAITGRMGWSGGSVSGSWPAICAISPRPRSNKAQQERNSAVKLGIVEPPSPLQARLSISHRILVLEGARLKEVHLEGAELKEAHLECADLAKSHLEEAILYNAFLAGADFTEAHLESTDLTKAHLEDQKDAEERV